MTRATHLAIGTALGLGLSMAQQEPVILSLFAAATCAMAAVLPDIDLRIGLKHRGITHSLFMWAVVTVAAYLVLPLVAFAVTAGYASHLILDMLTPMGVPLFAPLFQKRFRIAKWSTGGGMDWSLWLFAALTTIYLVTRL